MRRRWLLICVRRRLLLRRLSHNGDASGGVRGRNQFWFLTVVAATTHGHLRRCCDGGN